MNLDANYMIRCKINKLLIKYQNLHIILSIAKASFLTYFMVYSEI